MLRFAAPCCPIAVPLLSHCCPIVVPLLSLCCPVAVPLLFVVPTMLTLYCRRVCGSRSFAARSPGCRSRSMQGRKRRFATRSPGYGSLLQTKYASERCWATRSLAGLQDAMLLGRWFVDLDMTETCLSSLRWVVSDR